MDDELSCFLFSSSSPLTLAVLLKMISYYTTAAWPENNWKQDPQQARTALTTGTKTSMEIFPFCKVTSVNIMLRLVKNVYFR
jgi:hypothetical protein